MKVLFIISLIALTFHASGQSLIEIKKLLTKRNFTALENYISKLKKKSIGKNNSSNVKVSWKLKSDLTPNYQECIVAIEASFSNTGDSKICTVKEYRINILASAKEIIYYNFSEKVSTTSNWDNFSFNILDSFRNEFLLNKLSDDYFDTYKTSLNKKELFIDTCIYGKSCYLGEKPELRLKLDIFINNNDIVKINNWLTSQIDEKQVYGIEALYKMKNNGYIFTIEQKRLIEIISAKKGYITVCKGCIFRNILLKDVVNNIKKGIFM